MLKVKVRNLTSSRSGREVANQFVISIDDPNGNDIEVFQSYKTAIARKTYGADHSLVLDTRALNYSVTTSRYLFQFLGMKRKEVEAAIKDGTIKTENLN